jgi:hypothetical protein
MFQFTGMELGMVCNLLLSEGGRYNLSIACRTISCKRERGRYVGILGCKGDSFVGFTQTHKHMNKFMTIVNHIFFISNINFCALIS